MCLNFFGRTDAFLNQQCRQALDLELESSIYSEYPPNVLKCRSFGGCFEESLAKWWNNFVWVSFGTPGWYSAAQQPNTIIQDAAARAVAGSRAMGGLCWQDPVARGKTTCSGFVWNFNLKVPKATEQDGTICAKGRWGQLLGKSFTLRQFIAGALSCFAICFFCIGLAKYVLEFFWQDRRLFKPTMHTGTRFGTGKQHI